MGTWNYGKSPRICTLAYMDIDCPEFTEEEVKDEYSSNAEFMGESYDLEHAKHDLEEQFYEYINDRFKDCKFELENQGFKYYKVLVEGGYYQGFCVEIDHEFLYLDSPLERLEMHKELTQLRTKLRHCIREFGLRVHYPSWCPGWEDTIEKSLTKLQESIKKEREFINNMLVIDEMVQKKNLTKCNR